MAPMALSGDDHQRKPAYVLYPQVHAKCAEAVLSILSMSCAHRQNISLSGAPERTLRIVVIL